MSEAVRCSFCGKSQREVKKLVRGSVFTKTRRAVFICDECVGLCADIIAEEVDRDAARAQPKEKAP